MALAACESASLMMWAVGVGGAPLRTRIDAMELPFQPGRTYVRRHVWEAFGLSSEDVKGGVYTTGYAWVGNCCVIFANIGVAGRTGHDYANAFQGDSLVWWSKSGRTLQNPEIKRIRSPSSTLVVFHRAADRDPWTFWGTAKVDDQPEEVQDPNAGSLVKFLLHLLPVTSGEPPAHRHDEIDRIEIDSELANVGMDEAGLLFPEHQAVEENWRILRTHLVRERRAGSVKKRMVERISRRGQPIICEVCGFHFRDRYGVDFDFIEAHHRAPLGTSVAVRHTVEADLALLCANCHRAIHRMDQPMTVEQFTAVVRARQSS